jgi:hypothetical protein
MRNKIVVETRAVTSAAASFMSVAKVISEFYFVELN